MMMFSAESPAHSGQADILNAGSCVETRQSPSEGGSSRRSAVPKPERNTNMFKRMISFVAVAGLVLALAPAAQAGITFDTFTTDPNLATEWTQYSYYGTEDTTPTWNSTDEDLDLAGGGGLGKVLGLYRNGTTRSATDPVTLTVNDLAMSGGTWGYVALMISAGTQPSLTGGANRYEFKIIKLAAGYRYDIKANNGTDLYADTASAFSGPVTLDIVRNGDNYDFKANGTTLVSANSFTPAQHDAMVYYEIIFGGDGALTGTVDDFGVIPEPATLSLLALGGLMMLKRRRNA